MRELVQKAMNAGRMVDLQREGLDDDRMGWVVASGEEWLLLHQVSDRIWLDGYLAMRFDDVTAMEWLDDVNDAFVPRAMALREQAPVAPPVDMTSTAALVRSLAAVFPLVSLLVERGDDDYAVIGELVEATDAVVTLRSISPSAEWEDGLEDVSVSDITSVVADGEYERALALVTAST